MIVKETSLRTKQQKDKEREKITKFSEKEARKTLLYLKGQLRSAPFD